MTEAQALYLDLLDLGVTLAVEDGLIVARPLAKAGEAMRKRIRECRDGLLALLSEPDPEYAARVAWFGGVEVPDGLLLETAVTVTDGARCREHYAERIRLDQMRHETVWFLRRLRAALAKRGGAT